MVVRELRLGRTVRVDGEEVAASRKDDAGAVVRPIRVAPGREQAPLRSIGTNDVEVGVRVDHQCARVRGPRHIEEVSRSAQNLPLAAVG
jgi:hypothetical protein